MPPSSWTALDDGLVLTLPQHQLKIQILTSNILRIVIVPPDRDFDSPPSLVVLPQWEPVEWALEQEEDSLRLSTSRISATVSISDGRLVFRRPDGETLLQANGVGLDSLVKTEVMGESGSHLRQVFHHSGDEGLYGLGQYPDGVFNWRGQEALLVQANRNIAVPFLLSSRCYGLLWDNYSKTKFQDGPQGMSFWSEVGDRIDYLFVCGSSMDEVIAGYRTATGVAPLFPRWAYGYWQSKEHYDTQAEVLEIANEFRRRGFPIDALVQDWRYWGENDHWSGMIWDPERYPLPEVLFQELHGMGFHLMCSVWPAVGVNTDLYQALQAKGLVYPDRHWSGGKLLDAYHPQARRIYWETLNRGLFSKGLDAIWLDATEPELTSTDNPYITEVRAKGLGRNFLGSYARYLNTYSLLLTRGLYQGWRAASSEKRPFILTRSSFAGQQRQAALPWSGDIGASWDILRKQIPAGLNICMAGLPYWTLDIGGFMLEQQGGMYPHEEGQPYGCDDPAYQELYVRWFQYGAFLPVFRSHGTNTPREPWRFGEPGSQNYEAMQKACRLRYRLLPYIYSQAWQVTSAGSTILRGLPLDFPDDAQARSTADEFLFGPSILVHPVTRPMTHPTRKQERFIPAAQLSTPEGELGVLKVEFFEGRGFEKKESELRMDEITVGWLGVLPDALVESDYSVRWTGQFRTSAAGEYRFFLRTSGGYRLHLGGKTVCENWDNQESVKVEAVAVLPANSALDILLEHYQPEASVVQLKLEFIPPDADTGLAGTEVECYLPEGAAWYDFWSGRRSQGGQTIRRDAPLEILPLFVRAGSLLALGPDLQYTGEKPADPIELRVYPGADADFLLYEDEGDGQAYEQGVYATIRFHWDEAAQALTIGQRLGAFPGMLNERTFNLVMVREGHGVGVEAEGQPKRSVRYVGEEIKIAL